MSRSWRRQLCAALFADRVAWAVRDGGLRSAISAQGAEAWTPPAGDSSWRPSFEALKDILRSRGAPRTELIALLSGRFARALLVPWPAEVQGESEGAALAEHHFRRVFGDDAAQWEIAFDRESDGALRLACAVERELLQALRALAAEAGVQLVSVTPLFVSGINLWRRKIGRKPTLFVLAEADRYCAAAFANGEWSALRCGRLGEGADSLSMAIERESVLAGAGELQILGYAPELPVATLSPELAPRFARLALADRPSVPAEIDPRAAFAVGALA